MATDGYQLFRELIPDSVWQEIRDDQLVYVVPDSAMSGLPLEMLIVHKPQGANARDNSYWLDEGPLLCYGPSAAALLELRRQEPDRSQKTYLHEAVLLGDPVLQPQRRRSASPARRRKPARRHRRAAGIDAAESIGLASSAPSSSPTARSTFSPRTNLTTPSTSSNCCDSTAS